MRLSSKPSDSRIGFGAKEGLPDLGSRLALISSDRAALGLWTDTRAGMPETQKQDLAAGRRAVSDPEQLSCAAKAALFWGGLLAGLAGLALLALLLRGRSPAAPRLRRPDAGRSPHGACGAWARRQRSQCVQSTWGGHDERQP